MTTRYFIASGLVTLLMASWADAAPGMKVREQAIETSTRETSLPGTQDGSMIVKTCASCAPLVLRLTPQSRYRVGRDEVSFTEFAAELNGASRDLYVFYDATTRTITRLVTSGTSVGPAAGKPPRTN